MKEGAKLLAAAAAAVLLVQIHRKEKERLALGWAGPPAYLPVRQTCRFPLRRFPGTFLPGFPGWGCAATSFSS